MKFVNLYPRLAHIIHKIMERKPSDKTLFKKMKIYTYRDDRAGDASDVCSPAARAQVAPICHGIWTPLEQR